VEFQRHGLGGELVLMEANQEFVPKQLEEEHQLALDSDTLLVQIPQLVEHRHHGTAGELVLTAVNHEPVSKQLEEEHRLALNFPVHLLNLVEHPLSVQPLIIVVIQVQALAMELLVLILPGIAIALMAVQVHLVRKLFLHP